MDSCKKITDTECIIKQAPVQSNRETKKSRFFLKKVW